MPVQFYILQPHYSIPIDRIAWFSLENTDSFELHHFTVSLSNLQNNIFMFNYSFFSIYSQFKFFSLRRPNFKVSQTVVLECVPRFLLNLSGVHLISSEFFSFIYIQLRIFMDFVISAESPLAIRFINWRPKNIRDSKGKERIFEHKSDDRK